MAKKKYIPYGLSVEEVNERFALGQRNTKRKSNLKSVWKIITENLFSYFNMILAIIALLLISIKSYKNIWFLLIAVLNTLIGIVQELKARATIKNLSLITQKKIDVYRQGFKLEIEKEDLVLGDLFYLDAGDQVIADGEVEDGTISVNESNLTGEADLVIKKAGDKILSGSFIVSGEAYIRATAVGKESYIQQLEAKVQKLSKPKSVILNSLRRLLKLIGIIIIPLGLMTFYNVFRNQANIFTNAVIIYDYLPDFIKDPRTFTIAVEKMAGAMVAMVPSGLFLLTTITFANSVIRLAKRKTLVQELYSIETLARVDTLCLDKTGTITDGSMAVEEIEILNTSKINNSELEEKEVNIIIASMNKALEDKNQTAMALHEHFGSDSKIEAKKILNFNSQNKYSAAVFMDKAYALGAPEMVYKGKYTEIRSQVMKHARKGKRVLLLAQIGDIKKDKISGKVSPMALIVINDNVRDSAVATIQKFTDADVNVKVISGDNEITVAEIAKKAGVIGAKKYISMEKVTDEQIEEVALEYNVFGRVSPNQKKLLIQALQDHDKKVCMIGDGVNDILALKQADVSVALASGTDASRNISHLVLLDNNFSTLPDVVNHGRQIVSNMEKASVLYLVKTLYTIILTFLLLLTSKVYPFEPIHMFVVETFIIGVPSFFIALEPNHQMFKGHFLKNVMKNVVPGALIIVANIVAVYFFSNVFYNINDEISTVAIMAVTFAYWMVLVNMCRPLNKRRTLLIIFSALASLISFISFSNFFNLTALSTISFLLLLLLMETTYLIWSVYKKEIIKFWA